MRSALSRTGFRSFDIRTMNWRYIWRYRTEFGAHLAEDAERLPLRLNVSSQFLTELEQALLLLPLDVGECLAVRAVKP